MDEENDKNKINSSNTKSSGETQFSCKTSVIEVDGHADLILKDCSTKTRREELSTNIKREDDEMDASNEVPLDDISDGLAETSLLCGKRNFDCCEPVDLTCPKRLKTDHVTIKTEYEYGPLDLTVSTSDPDISSEMSLSSIKNEVPDKFLDDSNRSSLMVEWDLSEIVQDYSVHVKNEANECNSQDDTISNSSSNGVWEFETSVEEPSVNTSEEYGMEVNNVPSAVISNVFFAQTSHDIFPINESSEFTDTNENTDELAGLPEIENQKDGNFTESRSNIECETASNEDVSLEVSLIVSDKSQERDSPDELSSSTESNEIVSEKNSNENVVNSEELTEGNLLSNSPKDSIEISVDKNVDEDEKITKNSTDVFVITSSDIGTIVNNSENLDESHVEITSNMFIEANKQAENIIPCIVPYLLSDSSTQDAVFENEPNQDEPRVSKINTFHATDDTDTSSAVSHKQSLEPDGNVDMEEKENDNGQNCQIEPILADENNHLDTDPKNYKVDDDEVQSLPTESIKEPENITFNNFPENETVNADDTVQPVVDVSPVMPMETNEPTENASVKIPMNEGLEIQNPINTENQNDVNADTPMEVTESTEVVADTVPTDDPKSVIEIIDITNKSEIDEDDNDSCKSSSYCDCGNCYKSRSFGKWYEDEEDEYAENEEEEEASPDFPVPGQKLFINDMDDKILELCLAGMSMKEKHNAMLVCKKWYQLLQNESFEETLALTWCKLDPNCAPLLDFKHSTRKFYTLRVAGLLWSDVSIAKNFLSKIGKHVKKIFIDDTIENDNYKDLLSWFPNLKHLFLKNLDVLACCRIPPSLLDKLVIENCPRKLSKSQVKLIKRLQQMKSVKNLEATNCPVKSDLRPHYNFIKFNQTLETEFELLNSPSKIMISTNQNFLQHKPLTHDDITGLKFESNGIDAIAELLAFTNLEKLSINFENTNKKDATKQKCFFEHDAVICPKVKYLEIILPCGQSVCSICFDALLESFPNVTSLHLKGKFLADHLWELAEHHPHLEELTFTCDYNKSFVHGFNQPILGAFKNLKKLKLCSINSYDFENWPLMPSLQELVIDGLPAMPSNRKFIHEFGKKMPQLKKFESTLTKFDENCFDLLLRSMPNLQSLAVQYDSKMQLKSFKTHCTKLQYLNIYFADADSRLNIENECGLFRAIPSLKRILYTGDINYQITRADYFSLKEYFKRNIYLYDFQPTVEFIRLRVMDLDDDHDWTYNGGKIYPIGTTDVSDVSAYLGIELSVPDSTDTDSVEY